MMLNGFTQTLNNAERDKGTSMGQGLTLISMWRKKREESAFSFSKRGILLLTFQLGPWEKIVEVQKCTYMYTRSLWTHHM